MLSIGLIVSYFLIVFCTVLYYILSLFKDNKKKLTMKVSQELIMNASANDPMISSSDEKLNDGEAEAFARLYLRVEKESGEVKLLEVDCGIKVQILGLKEDFSHLTGFASTEQTWYNNETLLDDNKTLMDYGIGTQQNPKHNIRIVKSETNPDNSPPTK